MDALGSSKSPARWKLKLDVGKTAPWGRMSQVQKERLNNRIPKEPEASQLGEWSQDQGGKEELPKRPDIMGAYEMRGETLAYQS